MAEPKVTGLICTSCKRPVAVIAQHAYGRVVLLKCPVCGHGWMTDEVPLFSPPPSGKPN